MHECVPECLCYLFGREAITGSKQGLCVVSVCSANRSLSKGVKGHSSPPKGQEVKVQLREETGSSGASQVNAKANVSRSRDCNLEGVPTEVNHSYCIPGALPCLEKVLQYLQGRWGGVQRPEGEKG